MRRFRDGGITLHTSDELIAEAVKRTGLEDFDGESWREGLTVLIEAVHSEGHPNATGIEALEAQVLQFLINRLEITDWFRRHPEIDQEIIAAPIFSVGMVRTGTTALSFLLDQDPGNRSLLHWQAMYPCPPPFVSEAHDDPKLPGRRSKWA